MQLPVNRKDETSRCRSSRSAPRRRRPRRVRPVVVRFSEGAWRSCWARWLVSLTLGARCSWGIGLNPRFGRPWRWSSWKLYAIPARHSAFELGGYAVLRERIQDLARKGDRPGRRGSGSRPAGDRLRHVADHQARRHDRLQRDGIARFGYSHRRPANATFRSNSASTARFMQRSIRSISPITKH